MAILVDLDGTLAEYGPWNGGEIGSPVPLMLERVKKWLECGEDVRIFTARVGFGEGYSDISGRSDDAIFINEQRQLIEVWCLKHIGQILPVTAIKTFATKEIWDDLAIQVIINTGQRIDGCSE